MQIVPVASVWISYQINGSSWEYLNATTSNGVMTVTNPSSNTTTVNFYGVFRVS